MFQDELSKDYSLPSFPPSDVQLLLKQAEKNTENALSKWQEAEKLLEETKVRLDKENEERKKAEIEKLERERMENEKQERAKEERERLDREREREREALVKELSEAKEKSDRFEKETLRLRSEITRIDDEKRHLIQVLFSAPLLCHVLLLLIRLPERSPSV